MMRENCVRCYHWILGAPNLDRDTGKPVTDTRGRGSEGDNRGHIAGRNRLYCIVCSMGPGTKITWGLIRNSGLCQMVSTCY
jgi:hypothetical protein